MLKTLGLNTGAMLYFKVNRQTERVLDDRQTGKHLHNEKRTNEKRDC